MANNEPGEPILTFDKKFSFDIWDETTTKKAFDFSEGYRDFLSRAKTERLAVDIAQEMAKKAGFRILEHVGENNEKGFKNPVYSINRGKAIILAKPGKRPVKDGVLMVLAHIDSPHIDLKVKPLYESEHIAFLKSQYYGGIKKYQWTTLPLAMHGVITKQDGTRVDINFGDNPEDPIFMITDIAPHLDKIQSEKKIDEAIPAETMNVVVGSIGAKGKENDKDLVKKNILTLLNVKYGITEEDFVSADLELVPAGPARDLGFDRSLIAGFGHDDRSCSYAALEAILQSAQPEYATMTILVDKEEIGSQGATGAQSNFIADFVSELLYLETGEHNENILRDTFFKSKAVSADTVFGFDPDYSEVFDSLNTARIGAGVVIEKYTGGGGKYYSSEATSEFTAHIRNILNTGKVSWQSGGGGKVDMGGGATIAMYLARLNMDIIDLSIPTISIHAPFEIVSKADIYSAYLAYKAFFESK